MCSSTRGPAIAPSLVTWPIKEQFAPLAWRASCAVHSRSCATEPGADCSASDQSVWMDLRDLRALRVQRRGDALELDLRDQVHRVRVEREALCPHGDLLRRFFA